MDIGNGSYVTGEDTSLWVRGQKVGKDPEPGEDLRICISREVLASSGNAPVTESQRGTGSKSDKVERDRPPELTEIKSKVYSVAYDLGALSRVLHWLDLIVRLSRRTAELVIQVQIF